MLKRLYPVLIGALCSAMLTACQPPPKLQSFPKPDFTAMPPVRLNIADVQVHEEYISPFKEPNVEHYFPTPPAEGVKIWARDRIQPAGTAGRIDIVIQDASVVESKLPRTTGLKGAFTKDQSTRYDGRLEVDLKLYDGQDIISRADAHVEVTKTQTIGEDATVADRDRLFDSMCKEMLATMNAELEKNIRQYFAAYLK